MKHNLKNWITSTPEAFPEAVAGVTLSAAIFITTMNGIGRYFFNHTFVWTDEIVAICFAWTVFFRSAAACRLGMHYGLELLAGVLSPKGKKVLNIVVSLLSLVLIGCLAWLAWVLTSHVGTKIMTATRLSYRWLDLGMALGLSLMVIYSAGNFVRTIRGKTRGNASAGQAENDGDESSAASE